MAHAAVWPTTQVLLVKTIAPAAVAEGAPVREGNAFASLDGVELTAPCQCAATGTEIAQFQAGCEFHRIEPEGTCKCHEGFMGEQCEIQKKCPDPATCQHEPWASVQSASSIKIEIQREQTASKSNEYIAWT